MSEFPNCEIKLCDLEVSRVIQDHEEIREIIGTPDYVGKKGDNIFYWFLRGINIFSAWDPCLWTNQSGCRHLVTRSARLCSPHWLLTIRRSVSASFLLSMTVPFTNICILGETDQETLRNITSATLDFPAELFEGVSEEAKEFIKECLNRNPK